MFRHYPKNALRFSNLGHSGPLIRAPAKTRLRAQNSYLSHFQAFWGPPPRIAFWRPILTWFAPVFVFTFFSLFLKLLFQLKVVARCICPEFSGPFVQELRHRNSNIFLFSTFYWKMGWFFGWFYHIK